MVDLLRVRAQEKKIEISARCESKIPTIIQSDPTRLRQILLNLVGNAIKFTQEGSVEIALSARETSGGNGELRIDVTDTGIGLSEDQLSILFKRFAQADSSTTRRFGGTGLGLTISRSFCRMMGGDLTAVSTPGEGSTFTIMLPRFAPETATMTSPGIDITSELLV